MGKIALLDADQLVYASALKYGTNFLDVLTRELDGKIATQLTQSKCSRYRIFVGSSDKTFREDLNPEYKANRTPTPHKHVFRDHLVNNWGAIQCIGYEVDDAQAMEQNENTILIHDDKDLLQVPGEHFITEKWRLGEKIREHEFKTIDPLQGLIKVYAQSLIGDVTDNVIGIRGIGVKGALQRLNPCKTEQEMYAVCKRIYKDDNRFHMNMNMLWLWRKFGECYTMRPIFSELSQI